MNLVYIYVELNTNIYLGYIISVFNIFISSKTIYEFLLLNKTHIFSIVKI